MSSPHWERKRKTPRKRASVEGHTARPKQSRPKSRPADSAQGTLPAPGCHVCRSGQGKAACGPPVSTAATLLRPGQLQNFHTEEGLREVIWHGVGDGRLEKRE